jgi:hypothetical protein
MLRTVRVVPFPAFVAAGAVLLLLGVAAAMGWRPAVVLGPAPGNGPAYHSSAAGAVLPADVRQDGAGNDQGASGQGGSGQGGSGQGGNGLANGAPKPGEGITTPELPSGFLLLLGLIPLAVTGVLVRRRGGSRDAG